MHSKIYGMYPIHWINCLILMSFLGYAVLARHVSKAHVLIGSSRLKK